MGEVLSQATSCHFFAMQVNIRLGHVTAMTLSQAVKIRDLGLDFELNSSSNLCTRAVEHKGHLPVIKVGHLHWTYTGLDYRLHSSVT